MPKFWPNFYQVNLDEGAGKTTVLELLRKLNHPDWKLIDEPVAKWREVIIGHRFYSHWTLCFKAGKENIMDLNYKDPKRWAFTMQTNVVMTRDPRTASWSELVLDSSNFSGAWPTGFGLWIPGYDRSRALQGWVKSWRCKD